nr:hypothetical protein CFP56_32760 [Quercus suber]
MTRSKAHLPGIEGEAKGEGAQGEDIAAKGGDIDEEIDNFTLGSDDMQASPSQAQPQAPSQAPNHLDLLLDKLDQLQRSQEVLQRTLDEHYVYSRS